MPETVAVKLTFRLTRPAKKGGGDRYEHELPAPSKSIVIYVPQFISRAVHWKMVAEEVEITFEPK